MTRMRPRLVLQRRLSFKLLGSLDMIHVFWVCFGQKRCSRKSNVNRARGISGSRFVECLVLIYGETEVYCILFYGNITLFILLLLFYYIQSEWHSFLFEARYFYFYSLHRCASRTVHVEIQMPLLSINFPSSMLVSKGKSGVDISI